MSRKESSMAEAEIEKLTQAIKLTQKLRASVTKVFTDLSNGLSTTQGNESTHLDKLQKSLLTVNDNFSDLEKHSTNLANINTLVTPNTGLLNLDPIIDKTPVYSQLIHSHRWTNKIHKLADYATPILSQGLLKRTDQGGAPFSTKRIRRIAPIAHSTPPTTVEQIINAVGRGLPDMSISLSRPMGNCAVLKITLSRTLKGLVVLRGLLIESVIVKAYSEDFLTEDGKIDLWSKSRYQVFEKVTDMVTAATLHFIHAQMPELSLKSFLLWFNTYKNLFAAPCHKCGKHYQGGFPPVWRELRSSVPLHEDCRQT